MRLRGFPGRTVSFLTAMMVVAAVVPVAHGAKTPNGKKIIKQVQKAYDDLDSFSCRFKQEFTWALAGETDVTEGTMDLEKGDKFRFQTPAQIMVTDGTTLWRYSVPSGQVIVENLKSVEPGVLPREILFDYPKKFDVESVSTDKLDGNPVFVLNLVPKGQTQGLGVQKVTVWVDQKDSITRRMEFVDDAGNTTRYTLQDIRVNTPIPAEKFTLQVPDSVKVYDLR